MTDQKMEVLYGKETSLNDLLCAVLHRMQDEKRDGVEMHNFGVASMIFLKAAENAPEPEKLWERISPKEFRFLRDLLDQCKKSGWFKG